ncbi:MAG: hypothetical protein JRM80_07645 [Nitrososphaerota archaeon]|nr:hypothetical protein [Nitrososphaerota archaeon]
MSLNEKAHDLLSPLVGRTSAFLVSERGLKLSFARAILPHLAARGGGCRIFDLDAFFSSNLGEVTRNVPRAAVKNVELIIPEVGFDIESEIADLFSDESDRALIIDSTNTLNQLLASQKPRSASRELAFVFAALSNWARMNSRVVVANTYERNPPIPRRAATPFSRFFDLTISVSQRVGGVSLHCRKGDVWAGRPFFLSFQD